jgi:mono/diheme cytochrome c family protein
MKIRNPKELFYLVGIAFSFAAIFSFTFAPIPADDWVVPAKYKSMINPTDLNDAEGKSVGKSLYMKHCKSCHGKTGLGDGPKAEELDTPSGDFTTTEFQAYSDGSLFYKTKEGRDDMPGFGKKIADGEPKAIMQSPQVQEIYLGIAVDG